jgi:hypothetical protein
VVRGRLQRRAMDCASLIVVVAIVMATLEEIHKMNLGMCLSGPTSVAVAHRQRIWDET